MYDLSEFWESLLNLTETIVEYAYHYRDQVVQIENEASEKLILAEEIKQDQQNIIETAEAMQQDLQERNEKLETKIKL